MVSGQYALAMREIGCGRRGREVREPTTRQYKLNGIKASDDVVLILTRGIYKGFLRKLHFGTRPEVAQNFSV